MLHKLPPVCLMREHNCLINYAMMTVIHRQNPSACSLLSDTSNRNYINHHLTTPSHLIINAVSHNYFTAPHLPLAHCTPYHQYTPPAISHACLHHPLTHTLAPTIVLTHTHALKSCYIYLYITHHSETPIENCHSTQNTLYLCSPVLVLLSSPPSVPAPLS